MAPPTRSTLGIQRDDPEIVRVGSVDAIRRVLRTARESGRSLYPVSRGKNWGYGSALPVDERSTVLDLSPMAGIRDYDDRLGLVTVEPGVSQAQLHQYLQERGGRWIVPTSGAGPEASILGNALERGYGLAPHADHFGALQALEAVLADGRIYRSALTELGGARIDRCFKWGLGPYLDGLLTQSNYAVVTAATIALAPRPEQVGALMFRVDRPDRLAEAVDATQRVLREYGAVIQAVNLMNDRRVLSMIEPYPRDGRGKDGVVDEATVARLRRAHGLGPWTGFGLLAGPDGMLRAARGGIRRLLRGRVRDVRFLTLNQVRRVRRIFGRVPGQPAARLDRKAAGLEKALLNVSGVPSEVALPLAYWLTGRRPPEGEPMDPARDGCGLIWYSPLVPMDPRGIDPYVGYVSETCRAHGVEPLITLTSVSDRCFDSTVPLLFDPSEAGATERAHACYAALFERGRELGLLPYRLPITAMERGIQPDATCWQVVQAIKHALDPDAILAPGRYCPPPPPAK